MIDTEGDLNAIFVKEIKSILIKI